MHENVAVSIHSAFTVGVMCAILLPHLTKALVELKKKERVTKIAKDMEVSPYKIWLSK